MFGGVDDVPVDNGPKAHDASPCLISGSAGPWWRPWRAETGGPTVVIGPRGAARLGAPTCWFPCPAGVLVTQVSSA
jgi:hypothetical protein